MTEQPAPEEQKQPPGDVMPGVFSKIGELPAGALVTEDGLALLLKRGCRETIKRAVERGELPRPVTLLGKKTWTAGAIIRHHEQRLEEAARRDAKMRPAAAGEH